MSRESEKACQGHDTIDRGDMVECIACESRVAWDLAAHPFWGFASSCPLKQRSTPVVDAASTHSRTATGTERVKASNSLSSNDLGSVQP